MKQKKIKFSVLLFGLSLTILAQQATIPCGNNASGSGGTLSYSLGQTVYITHENSNGSVAQGVQQPYEISSVLGIDDKSFELDLTAYPNPTSTFLTLKSSHIKNSNLDFELYEVNGKLIERRKIISNNETILIENLPSGAYILKVSNNNNEFKTFKIIKN
jgi:hypothetical protein